MPFRFSFRIDLEATTVPYAPISDEIRRNRGFVDLRKQPEKAKDIAESEASPALRRLLTRVATVGSPIFTIGCDLGTHQEPTHVPKRRREVAGGYVQFASVQYDTTESEVYAAFANEIVAQVKPRAGDDHWKIDFIGKWVNFRFEDEPKGVRPTLWVWFFAAAGDPLAALQSRERLIEAIDAATALPATLKSFSLARNTRPVSE
jgi:hypothetical protein